MSATYPHVYGEHDATTSADSGMTDLSPRSYMLRYRHSWNAAIQAFDAGSICADRMLPLTLILSLAADTIPFSEVETCLSQMADSVESRRDRSW